MRWLFIALGATSCVLQADPCTAVFDETTADLLQLHKDAGRDRPELPDRQGWIRICKALDLDRATIACLGPKNAAKSPETCTALLENVDRTALDEAFLVIMIP